MIMKKIIVALLVIQYGFLFSQEDDSYNLDYNNSRNAAELCTEIKSSGFMSNAEADDALAKILSVVGASKRFIVAPCENINNALAVIDDGMRYILYDPEFINSISQTSDYWANMSILAHEVGHHINGHTLNASISAYENKIQELEADEFSGFVMQKIGATLDEAIDAIASIAPSGDDTYSSHPNKERRIKAITKGYNRARNNSFVTEKKLTDWEELFYRGNEKFDAENYEGALEDFTESLKLKPDASTYLNRAMVKENLDDNSGAKFDFLRSIELSPNGWEAHYRLGRNLYYSDDLYGAISSLMTYENLVNWTGDYYDIYSYYFISNSFNELGFYEKALDYINYVIDQTDFTSVIESALEYSAFYRLRGRINLSLNNFEESRSDLIKASELNPESAFTVELIGDSYLEEKNYQLAIDFYDQALDLDPDKYSIYEYRAYAYEALEDYFNALLDMNEAIKQNPDYSYLYFKRGEYSLKLGNNDNACSDWLIGREKGSEDSLVKLFEICGYAKEDFYTADEFLDQAAIERDNDNYTEALRLIDKAQALGYEDIFRLKSYYYSVYSHMSEFNLALETLNSIAYSDEEDVTRINWIEKEYLFTYYSLSDWNNLISNSSDLIKKYKLDPDALDYSLDLEYIKENADFIQDIYDLRGQAFDLIGDFSNAIENNDKFLKVGKAIESDDYIRIAFLRNAEAKNGAEDFFGAIQDINEYIKLRESYSLGYRVRGEIKLKMGDSYVKYACEDFNLALKISLNNEIEDEDDQLEIQKLIDEYCN